MTFRWYKRLPIPYKMRLLLMLCGLAFITCFGSIYIYYGAHSLQVNLLTETVTTANLIGSRNVAAMRFDNKEFAEKQLKVITDSSYETICLINAANVIFASSGYANLCPSITPAWNGVFNEYATIENNNFVVLKNIFADGELIGAIWIKRNQNAVMEYIYHQLNTMIIIGLLSVMMCYFVASYLQKFISDPIIEMVQNTRQLMAQPYEEMHLIRKYEDELGQVAESFNSIFSNLSTQLKIAKWKHGEVSRAYKNLQIRIDELIKEFSVSAGAFLAYSEMTTKNLLGTDLENYIPYQHDVVEALATYNLRLDSLKKISQIYGDALSGESIYLDMNNYFSHFTNRLKTQLPFIGIYVGSEFQEQPSCHIKIYKSAWEETFSILFNLISVISGIVEFTPKLEIQLLNGSKISFIFHNNMLPNSAIHVDDSKKKLGEFFSLSTEETGYKKNTIEDPDIGEEFFDEEILSRADFQYILDCIIYIASANSIAVTHGFGPQCFSLHLDLSETLLLAEASKSLVMQ